MTSTMQFPGVTKTAEASSTSGLAGVLASVKGWHADPRGRHDLRYHDGTSWTEHVTHFGPVPCSGCNPLR